MDDTVHETETSSSSQDSDCILSCSSNSMPSQQSISGSQSQTRQRRSLSLKKNRMEKYDLSDSCLNGITERKSRQSLFSSIGFPGSDSNTSMKDNSEFVECHSLGQSVVNNTTFRSKITEHCENLSKSKESTTPDILNVCELILPSQESRHSSSIISSQHKVDGSGLQNVDEHCRLSHEKRQNEKKGQTEQQQGNSERKRLRKSLFDTLDEMSSSNSSDDVKMVAELTLPSSQVQKSGNASNVIKTSKLSTDKPLQHADSEKQEPCSSSHDNTSSYMFKSKNIFDSFCEEKKTLADNVTISQLQNPAKIATFATKVMKETPKQKLHEDAILIVDSSSNSTNSGNSNVRLSANMQENTRHNIFAKISHEKKNLTECCIATPKLENQTEKAKFTAKVVKGTLKQNSREEAIVIADSPNHKADSCNSNVRLSTSVQEHTMHNEEKHKVLANDDVNSHLNHQNRTLSKIVAEKQENISGDFNSQKDNASASSTSALSADVFKYLKQNRSSIRKLLSSKILSVSQNQKSSKELPEDPMVISSDEETETWHGSQQVTKCHRRESDSNNKTLGLKRCGSSKSTSSSQKQHPSTNVKQSQTCQELVVANSFNTSDSCCSGVLKTFPALVDSSIDSSLSEEIPDQGEMHNQSSVNRDSTIPSLITMPSHASITSMPSLQRKPSSMYRNSSFEECSPPLLSQYPIESPTSLHQPEVISLADSLSPVKDSVVKSISEDIASIESCMFSECSDPCIDNDDNLNGRLCKILDMIDSANDDQHSTGITHPGCSTDSKSDSLMQSCGLKSSKSSHIIIPSESSPIQLNTAADLEVVKKEKSDSAVKGKEKSNCYSEGIYILDSDDEFLLSQSTQDIHCSKEHQSKKSVKDGGEKSTNVNKMDSQVLIASNFDDRMTVNHLKESRQASLEDIPGFRIDVGLTAYEKGKDQNDLAVALASQDLVVCANKQHCEPESSAAADFTVTVALSSGGRSQTSDEGLAVVKEEVDDNAYTGAADSSMYSEINDELYILDSDDDEFFMSQSVLSNHCADEPVNGGGNQTSDIDLAVVKEEVHDNTFAGAADVSVYSEINDELYILDSDDDEFFMTQSVLSEHCADKQEEVQNCTENKRLEMYEKDSLDLFEDECDDKVIYNKQLSENDNIFIKDKPSCSLANGVDLTGFEFGSKGNDSNFHDFDKEGTLHSRSLKEASVSSEDINSSCSEVANTGNLNEPCEVNIDDMTKSTVDDDDEYFLSQMDDVSDDYFAHTQIDYTINSDDELGDAEVKYKEDCNVSLKSSRIDRNSPVTCDRLDKSLKHPQYVKNDSESSMSSCEDVDTQDPFAVETQVCCPSVTSDQNQYDVETLPTSIFVDEDVHLQVNSEMHTTLKGLAKQNVCDNKTATIYKTAGDNQHEEKKWALSPLLNSDTQDPFNIETQQNSDILMKENHLDELGLLPVSSKFLVESVFTMETQENFEGDHQGTDPYNKETLAVSPSESEDSECVFTLQTQVISKPETNGKRMKGRETVEVSSNLREDQQNIPDTKTIGSFKLARNDQPKNVPHMSCALLNNSDLQDQCDNSTQENNQIEEDDIYQVETQVLYPGEKLQSSYSIATQKYLQSESKGYQASVALLNDDDTQEGFDLTQQDIDHLLSSEEDYCYEGQTQVFSPDTLVQDSYNIATQKQIQSEAKCQHTAIAVLNNDDDDIQPQFDTSAQGGKLQSEADDAYGGQTQLCSLSKELQSSYDTATQKNFQSEKNDHHLFDTQTLADSTMLDDATQDLSDDETLEQTQPASNDKYLYVRQTLANSPKEEPESIYNMVTQRQFESEERDHSLHNREKCDILISVGDITQDPPKKEATVNQQTVLEDRCPYEQETLASSSSKEIYDLPTQENAHPDRNDLTLSDKEMPAASDEDTQDPSKSETQAFHLASEGGYPWERKTLVAGQDEDCESLYSKATQKICQPEKYSPYPYNRETLQLSPTVGKTMTHLLTDDNGDSKLHNQCSVVGEKLSPSSLVDTQDPFDMEADVSTLEDQDEEIFTASPSFTRNMKTDASCGLPDREATAISTHLHDNNESSNDSECFFTVKTQKDSRLLVTDQDPYILQTQTISSSFNEDIHDPFSVDTLVDSPPGLDKVSPYSCKTLEISMACENSHDPFSIETQVDSSSFEETSSVSKETAVSTSSNEEADNNYVIETQNNISVQTLIPHGKIEAADLSEVGSTARERTCDLETKAQDNSLQYTENQTHKHVKSLTPETCGDDVSPRKTAQHNIEENVNCTPKKDSAVHHAQISTKSSDNQNLPIITSILRSIEKNKAPIANLIRKLSVNSSQKVHQASKNFKDDDNSSEQDSSPYFVNCKQSSPAVKDARITEPCYSSSSTKSTLEMPIEPKQNCLLSEPHDLSHRPNMENKATDKCVNNDTNIVLYNVQEMLHRSDTKELLAQDSYMGIGTILSSHPLKQDLIQQHREEKTAGFSESNRGSIKRHAKHNDKTLSKRKRMTKHHDDDTEDSHGIAQIKRSAENKAHNTILPDSKRLKVISTEDRWITARKGNINETKSNKSATVPKNTSKLKRPWGRVEKNTKRQFTFQVEAAKQILQNRMMESRSVKPVNEQKTRSLMSDDNDDVAMPSTQDIMNLGLPILSAKLPVSKKHLASGLPSQGRVASEDKELQDQNEDVPSGKLPSKDLYERKNSIQKNLLPSVPLFDPLTACQSISSPAAGVVMPAHSAVTLENPVSSVMSSTESKESCLDQSLMMPNCQIDYSGSESDKPITQTPKAVILPVFSSSETSAAETVHTSSATFTHANAAVSIHSGISVHPMPAQVSKRIYSSGPSLPTLQAVSKQSAGTKSNYQGILKSNKPSELNHNGRKAEFKVTFEDPSRERHSMQRHEIPLPLAHASQRKERIKCRPEAKLYFLTTLLHWNSMWLEEREGNKSLPALFGSRKKLEDICQLRMFYTEFDEYVDITLKLLILECWETIYRDWKMRSLKSPVKLEVHCICSPRQAYKEKEGQSLVCFEVAGLFTQQNRSNIPSVGDFLIMDFWGAKKLEKTHDKPRWCQQFAYVRSVTVQNCDMQFLQTHKIFDSSPARRDRKPMVVNMTLVIQFRGDIILPAKLHKIQVISSLKTIDRQVDALVNLPESPLCTQLLKPTQGALFTYNSVQPSVHLLSKLNTEQACSVATIVQEIKLSPTSEKMFLLQGPPGTGKSHTILALIHQILLTTNFKGRICLAAPSNAAVDEMARRIIMFSQKLKNAALTGISLVRVGNWSKVHQAVKPFMLEESVEKILINGMPESLKSELRALETEALKLEKVLSGESLTQEQKVIKCRKQKEIQAKIDKLKAEMAPKKKNGRERYKARCSVLDNAQVICGTLNSLGSEDLKEIILRSEENAHKKFPFTCLIIDEATQAIEVECLIPLQYKMTKVVLVGDSEQLPATVLSQLANEKQLARSLFERMDFCIKSVSGTSRSPVMMLTRQYRMHNEILNLPNSFFYDGRLVTDNSVLCRKEILAPYLVFDIQKSQESRAATTGSVSNEEEGVCIAQLCEIVSKRIDIDKIGVICPYSDQQQLILGCLHQRNLAVEVNTVDSFQGQEREVIILSCVRAQSNPSGIGFVSDRKRMNVALTRAKLALYIIGHFDTLKTDELWEQLYRNAVNRNLLVKVHKTSDFKLLAENAVCRMNNYFATDS